MINGNTEDRHSGRSGRCCGSSAWADKEEEAHGRTASNARTKRQQRTDEEEAAHGGRRSSARTKKKQRTDEEEVAQDKEEVAHGRT